VVAGTVTADVAVVGGGIMGASCAYWLAERGADVLVLESGRVGREASGVNAGGVRQQGRALAEAPLALRSVAVWGDLEARLAAPIEYERCGDLRIAETETDAERIRDLAAAERAAGLGLEWVEGRALRGLAPTLGPSVVAGIFCPTGGQANPLLVAPAFGRRARDLGARLWEHSPVLSLGRDGPGFLLRTPNGRVSAARLVLTAGAWTPALAACLGFTLPIDYFVPQMTATVPLPRLLGVVLLGASRPLSMKQMRSGAVLVGGGRRGWGDLATRARGPVAASVRLAARDAAAVLPVLGRTEMTRAWVGLEGVTADGLPVIDCLVPGRAWVAAGFCGHGFALGPVVGRLLAEWLLDGAPSLPCAAFGLARFAAR
jgi:sarcosine oxidase subunit beta